MTPLEKKHYGKRSIRMRTLLYFLILSFTLLVLLWLFQQWFFNYNYRPEKEKEIEKITEQIVEEYVALKTPGSAYFEKVYDEAFENDLNVYIITINPVYAVRDTEGFITGIRDYSRGCSVTMISAFLELSSINEQALTLSQWRIELARAGSVREGEKPDLEKGYGFYFNELFDGDAGENAHGQKYLYSDSDRFYYGYRLPDDINGYERYIFVNTVIANEKITIKIINYQFILIVLICSVLAIIFSTLISTLVSAPVLNLSREAQELSRGNYSVRFKKTDWYETDLLADTLNFAVEEMEKTEQLRRDFLANVSHDLRTPLTMVRAYAEMIRDISGKNPEKRAQHAQTIIDEADRLSSLVEDIQNLSKLQAGTETIEKDDFDICELCRAVINRFRIFNEKHGYTIKVEADGKLMVHADRRRIEQVLYNLIGNAINYTDKEEKLVVLRATADNKRALVEVIDHGKGIAPEEIDTVWDRYYRNNQIKRKVIGSGLGLSIVKSILTSHEAEFGIKSELGKGSDFWFALPIVAEELPPPQKVKKPRVKKVAPNDDDKYYD